MRPSHSGDADELNLSVDVIMYQFDRSFCLPMILNFFLFQLISFRVASAFTITSQQHEFGIHPFDTPSSSSTALAASWKYDYSENDVNCAQSRRDLFKAAFAPFIGTSALFISGTVAVATTTISSDTVAPIEMKTFIDPEGLFALKIPKSFFAIRRTNKGDLPNASTGSGRRGSSIFNAGDLAKAEVLAIERFPTRVLLEEYGIDATGSLATFPDIGEPSAIANLIAIRRDREKPVASNSVTGTSNTQIVPNSLLISADGRELSFSLRTAIDVQKPELLLEQYGVSTLNRITAAKASLRSNDGYMMAVFASALETDWQGPDGLALQDAVNSFEAIDQANTWPLADKFVMLDSANSM